MENLITQTCSHLYSLALRFLKNIPHSKNKIISYHTNFSYKISYHYLLCILQVKIYLVLVLSSTSGNQGSKVAEISSETVLVLRQVMNWKGNMTVKCLDSPPDYNNGTGNLNIKFGIFNGR